MSDTNAEWLLDEMLRRTGLRVRPRLDGSHVVYLGSADMNKPELLELEPYVCLLRVGLRGKLRERKHPARTLGKAILELNGIDPRVSRGEIQGKRTMRYDLAELNLQKHAKYLGQGLAVSVTPNCF